MGDLITHTNQTWFYYLKIGKRRGNEMGREEGRVEWGGGD
jgi:hypothetical protein